MSCMQGRSNRMSTMTHALSFIACAWLAIQAGASLAEVVTRPPYLLLGTPTSIQVRWKTDAASTGRVYYGGDPWKLTAFVDEAASSTDHSVTLNGLTPDTRYWYAVGNNTPKTLVSSLNHKF